MPHVSRPRRASFGRSRATYPPLPRTARRGPSAVSFRTLRHSTEAGSPDDRRLRSPERHRRECHVLVHRGSASGDDGTLDPPRRLWRYATGEGAISVGGVSFATRRRSLRRQTAWTRHDRRGGSTQTTIRPILPSLPSRQRICQRSRRKSRGHPCSAPTAWRRPLPPLARPRGLAQRRRPDHQRHDRSAHDHPRARRIARSTRRPTDTRRHRLATLADGRRGTQRPSHAAFRRRQR